MKPFEVVVVTGSAGALQALFEILEWLPAGMPVPVILVLHHGRSRTPMVMRLLQRHSRLPIELVTDHTRLRPGHVYLSPADQHMWISDHDRVSCGDHRKINFLRSSSEPLLDSVTARYGARGLAVILSGMGRNGAVAAKRLHDAGGTVLVQDRATSAHFRMPGAAIEVGAATEVLPLPLIGPRILRLNGIKLPAKAV